MEEVKERSVSYGELLELEEAFEMYTKGENFESEDKRQEALLDYESGYIHFPEEKGGVEEYIKENKPRIL